MQGGSLESSGGIVAKRDLGGHHVRPPTAMKVPKPTLLHSAPWAIDDEVIQVREWATELVFPLVAPPSHIWSLAIGTARTCALRLGVEHPQLAPVHARLQYDSRWTIIDAGSEHGLIIDGVRCAGAELRPGLEISLGGALTLVAESPRLIALRETLCQLLGWGAKQRAAVDLALRQVRRHDWQRERLGLCGREWAELVPIAKELHRLTLGARPFVVYPMDSVAQPPEPGVYRTTDLAEALAAAQDGTLCLLYDRLKPRERRQKLIGLYFALWPEGCLTHLVLCAERAPAQGFPDAPIKFPPLSTRSADLDRLIDECLREAAARLYCAKAVQLGASDRRWLRTVARSSPPELQEATLRLLALRETSSINGAAALLGISHTAVAKWIRQRGFPSGYKRTSPAKGGVRRSRPR